jgi:hypothetical protein
MDRHELTRLFWSDVEAVAAGFNVGIEEQCELRLCDLIEDDTGRIPDAGLLNNPRRIGHAEIFAGHLEEPVPRWPIAPGIFAVSFATF